MIRSKLHGTEESLIFWGKAVEITTKEVQSIAPSALSAAFKEECNQYFRLCALGRSTSLSSQHTSQAHDLLFRVRATLERSIEASARRAIKAKSSLSQTISLAGGPIFGMSKKQGTSVRLPLASCQPTRLCAPGCYAHDALDATPNSIVRGALNGLLASVYCENISWRADILRAMEKPTRRAIAAALAEQAAAKSAGYERGARIRLAHVGEATAYPDFTNDLANLIKKLSLNAVTPVIYTRHKDAKLLDSNSMVINFTIDSSSKSRLKWKPKGARLVASAFKGIAIVDASVNFVEHHRWTSVLVTTKGNLCPVTVPENSLSTCDEAKCNLCFEREL